jgi:DNA-binding transcriptional ArsR family regulator
MKASLIDFRAEFRDRLLDVLWRQWNTLGVSGHGTAWEAAPIDPEALLLVSCTVARHDARLFDAVLEWMRINGRYVNVQRVNRMFAGGLLAGQAVFRAVAAATKTSVHESKWGRSARTAERPGTKPVPLFYMRDGNPLPVVHAKDPLFAGHGLLRDRFEPRGVAQPARTEPAANLILRLRALLGVNARCEILAFLLLNERGSPRAVARDCCYFPATVSKALSEMGASGYVVSRVEGRHRYYKLVPDAWRELLVGDVRLSWVVWARLFSALEQLWILLWQAEFRERSPLSQASALRRILRESVVKRLDQSGLAFTFGDESAHTGEALIPFFVTRTVALLDTLERLGSAKGRA